MTSQLHRSDGLATELCWADYQARRAQAHRDAPRLRALAMEASLAWLRRSLTDLLPAARRAAPDQTGREQQPCLR